MTDSSHTHVKTTTGSYTGSSYLPKTDSKVANHETRIAALEAAVKALTPPPVVPPPPPPPPPVIVPGPVIDLQAAIDSAVPGSVIDCSGSAVFNKRIYLRHPGVTVKAAKLDGTGLGVPFQQGVIEATAVDCMLDHVRVFGSSGSGVYVNNGNGLKVVDCELDNNIQEGFNGHGNDILFLRTHIHHNNVARTVSSGWEAGGGKIHGSRIIFDSCESNHNGGPGLWADQWYASPFPANRNFNDGWVYRKNRVHHNGEAGIMYEVSDGGTALTVIEDNIVWNNGNTNAGWHWAAGILISSSKNVEVRRNTLIANLDGISTLSQNRADKPGPTTNVNIHDNVVIQYADVAGDSSDKSLIAFAQDWTGGMFDAASNNHGTANRYWSVYPEPRYGRFAWNGSQDTLAKLNATPAGGASTYLTTAEKDAIVAAAALT